MKSVLTKAFFDELEKIAAKRGPMFRSSISLHEMGHAKDFEKSRAPRLRKAVDVVGLLGGAAGAAYGVVKGRPLIAAAGGGVAALPTLSREAFASYHAMKAAKELGGFKPKELKKMRKQLMLAGGTYLAGAASSVGALAAAASGRGELAQLAGLGGTLGTMGLAAGMAAGLEKSPKTSQRDLDKIRKKMGLKAKIYEIKDQPGLGGRWSELGAAYMPKVKNRIMKMFAEKQVAEMLKTKDMKKIKRLLGEGGLLLPRAKV